MTAWIFRLEAYDQRLFRAVVTRRRAGVTDRAVRALTRLGDPVPAILAAIALALGLLPVPDPAGLEAAGALFTSHVLVQLLKRSVNRPRPRLPVGVGSLMDAPDRFSFPSGHAAAALSLALPLSLALSLPAGALLLGAACLVGISRCYLGVHYPGDVAAGWLLAILGAVAAHWILG